MELFAILFALAAVIMAAKYQQIELNRNTWRSLQGNRFCRGPKLSYEGVPAYRASIVLHETLSSGRFTAQFPNIEYGWEALFHSSSETQIEVTLNVQTFEVLKGEYFAGLKETILMRWLIANNTNKNGITISVEWTSAAVLSAGMGSFLDHISDLCRSRLAAAVPKIPTNMSSSAPRLIMNPGTIAKTPTIPQEKLLQETDFWTNSIRQFGVYEIPARIVEGIDPARAADLLSAYLKNPERLYELTTRWTGLVRELPTAQGKLIEMEAIFSRLDAAGGRMSESLATRWEFHDATIPGATLFRTEWTGLAQQAAKDLVNHLNLGFERELRNRGSKLHAAQSLPARGMAQTAAHERNWYKDADFQQKPFWPSMQDYNEAIQNPHLCFIDQDLRSGTPALNALGLPKVASGAFASVYRMHCNGADYALRCFNNHVRDQQDRYVKTSRFICSDSLPYTVPLHYLEKGILVKGQWFPVLKMEWVEGISIYQYIDSNISDAAKLVKLRESFRLMMKDLRNAGVAHSDLQHGNIIVRNEEIVLVDYDGMFVPELSGFWSNERGHPNYQHPARDGTHFGPYLDNFSAWIIDTALLCLIEDEGIWQRFSGDYESLLFKRSDFEHPDSSELLSLLCKNDKEVLQKRGDFLVSLLQLPVQQIPFLTELQANLAATDMTYRAEKGIPDWMNE